MRRDHGGLQNCFSNPSESILSTRITETFMLTEYATESSNSGAKVPFTYFAGLSCRGTLEPTIPGS